jgi:hypothetical protein
MTSLSCPSRTTRSSVFRTQVTVVYYHPPLVLQNSFALDTGFFPVFIFRTLVMVLLAFPDRYQMGCC